MKISKKEGSKIAKVLFSASLSGREIDTKRVVKNLKLVKRQYKTNSLDILKLYLSLVKKYLNRTTLRIETSSRLSSRNVAAVKSYFEKAHRGPLKVQKIINPELIGGLRIRLGDNEWDYSTAGKINQMKEVLSG